ncbi:MAG: hypothetical protein LBQ13_02070 [Endomicrobium sp.]|jgi:predicted DNA-binding transcriptional regulator AlpA|nr:hypothetical protein [Endomicrobium sp.]
MEQVCRYLNLSDVSVRRYMECSDFPASVKIKKRHQFNKAEIDCRIEEKTEKNRLPFILPA